MSEIQWFFIDGAGEKQGPHDMSVIQNYAIEGMIDSESLLWYEGLSEWAPAGHFPDISPHLAAQAPVQSTVQLQEAAPVEQNPYAAPQTNVVPGAAGGIQMTSTDFQFPAVKPVSFGKYLGFLIGGGILAFIGLMIIGTNAEPQEMTDEQAMEQIVRQMEAQENGETVSAYSSSTPMTGAQMAGIVVMLIGGALMLVGSIFGYIIIYRAWTAIQPGGARTTPGMAVGLLFVPFFSLYWTFIAYPGWADDWNRIRGSYGNLMGAPSATHGLFLTFPILILCAILPLVGFLTLPLAMIFSFICKYQMCQATNFIASGYSQQKMKQGGGGMQFY